MHLLAGGRLLHRDLRLASAAYAQEHIGEPQLLVLPDVIERSAACGREIQVVAVPSQAHTAFFAAA
jgi:hypothetical protein